MEETPKFIKDGWRKERDNNILLQQIEELKLLQDGWFDGQEGKKLDQQGLDWLAETFSRLYPENLPTPYLYPTLEGNVQLESTFGAKEVSLTVDLLDHHGEWQAMNVVTEAAEQRIVNLSNESGWVEFANLVDAAMKG